MRRLLNTLYVFTEKAYLALDGENVVVKSGSDELGRIPLHTLEGIACFSYSGASPALMGACAERGVALSFFDRRGRFLSGVRGPQKGNVLLRKAQYRVSEDGLASLPLAKSFIIGKLFNSRWVLERAIRDHALRLDCEAVRDASQALASALRGAENASSADELRGIEGEAASCYFGVFDQMVLRDKNVFFFRGRSRRPPLDPLNALLSLFYVVLAYDCASALEGVGLDPYVGFLHTDRPGRMSLALDLMEEFRSVVVDRFVLSSVNNRIIDASCFERRETGETLITSDGRKILFESWQARKRETITHPYLQVKVPWGLVPHVQALLLARCLRGDLDGYPPFLWK